MKTALDSVTFWDHEQSSEKQIGGFRGSIVAAGVVTPR